MNHWIPKFNKCKNINEIKVLKKEFLKHHTSTSGRVSNGSEQRFLKKEVLEHWNRMLKTFYKFNRNMKNDTTTLRG